MLLKNDYSPLVFWPREHAYVLDTFFAWSGKKQICLHTDAKVNYVALLHNANVDICIDLVWESAEIQFFGIFVGDVKSQVVTSLLKNITSAHLHLLCLVGENSTMCVNGNVFIGETIEKAEGHLLEEQFLLGKPKSLQVCPMLDVHSHRVKASHGAKIYMIDQQKLFYMMAKWLSLPQAQRMVVEWSLQTAFDTIVDVDSEQKQQLLTTIFDSIFISSSCLW